MTRAVAAAGMRHSKVHLTIFLLVLSSSPRFYCCVIAKVTSISIFLCYTLKLFVSNEDGFACVVKRTVIMSQLVCMCVCARAC